MALDPNTYDQEVLAFGVRNPLDTTAAAVPVEIDNYGPWLVTIDQPHHQIHEGETFTALAASTAMNAAGVLGVYVKNGAANYPHFVYSISASAAFNIDFYETPTVSASGTLLTSYNRNRSSSKTPTMYCRKAVTSTPGTLLESFHVGGGNQRNGGQNRSVSEWVLKPSTNYYLKLTSTAANNAIAANMEFYEEGAD